jgi:hypothetical protein
MHEDMKLTPPRLVEVYKWIVLALSISLNFWLRWLVHKA